MYILEYDSSFVCVYGGFYIIVVGSGGFFNFFYFFEFSKRIFFVFVFEFILNK